MRRFNVGLIGLGKQAVSDHLPILESDERVALVAVCDTSPGALKHYEGRARRYEQHERMFNDESLDFVVVATPHNSHIDIVRTAAEYGVDVVKEKPFATSLAEALEMVSLARSAGITVLTRLQRRDNPVYKKAQELIGRIQDPFLVDVKYTIPVKNPHSGWRGKRSLAGGGCVIDMGYHMIDLLIWYFGLPDFVHAEMSTSAKPHEHYDAEDTANILFKYNSGLHGTIRLSRYRHPKEESVEVVGSNAYLKLTKSSVELRKNDGELIESHTTQQLDHGSGEAPAYEELLRTSPGGTTSSSQLNHLVFIEACYTSQISHSYISTKELITKCPIDLRYTAAVRQ